MTPGAGSRYYLVVRLGTTSEGSYGKDSDGAERPPFTAACLQVHDPTSAGSAPVPSAMMIWRSDRATYAPTDLAEDREL